MYNPRHFQETRTEVLHALIEAHPLATWVTGSGDGFVINHVPFVLDRDRGPSGALVGHVARANPVWRQPAPSAFVFQATERYISPAWYATKALHGKVVPTWNYAVVHAHGTPTFIEDREWLRELVSRLTDRHEATRDAPWSIDDAPPDFIDSMLDAIVGVEIPIARLEGKWKVSQNRGADDRRGVAAGLRAARREDDEMATLVETTPEPAAFWSAESS